MDAKEALEILQPGQVVRFDSMGKFFHAAQIAAGALQREVSREAAPARDERPTLGALRFRVIDEALAVGWDGDPIRKQELKTAADVLALVAEMAKFEAIPGSTLDEFKCRLAKLVRPEPAA